MTTVRRFDAWLVLVALLACSEPPPTETGAEVVGSPDAPQPNVIVIVVDDLRFDEFGAGGHPYLETPNIDRLAAEGAMFSDAFHAVPHVFAQSRQHPHGTVSVAPRHHRLQTFPQAM
jgi:hypothetical protein